MNKRKEIEVKARVKNFSGVRSQLEKMGCTFGEVLVQNDTVFLPHGTTFAHITPGTNALRIREENSRILFTLKQRQNVELSAIEAEIEVENPSELRKIIE